MVPNWDHRLANESLVVYTDMANAGLKCARALANESEMLPRLSLANTKTMGWAGRVMLGLSCAMAESFQDTMAPDQMSANTPTLSVCGVQRDM
jgi:hypothetical protein